MSKLLSLIYALLLAITSPGFVTKPIMDVVQAVPEPTYIVNINTQRFHDTECSHADRISEKNRREYTGSRDELIKAGYVPCKVCNP